MDLGAFELAFDALRFDTCCVVWKDATRLSCVKKLVRNFWDCHVEIVTLLRSNESGMRMLFCARWSSRCYFGAGLWRIASGEVASHSWMGYSPELESAKSYGMLDSN